MHYYTYAMIHNALLQLRHVDFGKIYATVHLRTASYTS